MAVPNLFGTSGDILRTSPNPQRFDQTSFPTKQKWREASFIFRPLIQFRILSFTLFDPFLGEANFQFSSIFATIFVNRLPAFRHISYISFTTNQFCKNGLYSQKNNCCDNCNDLSDYSDIIAPLDKVMILHYWKQF